MSIQDDSLRNFMVTSAPDNDIIPFVCPDEVNSADGKRKQNFWNKNCDYFLIQSLPGMFKTKERYYIYNFYFNFFQVILCIWYASTCLMKNKPCYQPGRCTPLSQKCPNKQDWRSQIRSKTWPINAYMDITANGNSRAAPHPAEAKAWQRHISLLHQRNLLIRLPGLIGKLGADGPFQETGGKFICDNLCEKSKAAPVLSLIRNETCNGKIMGKVVRYCQSPVKATAKCHFLGNAAGLNRLCIRAHYAKEGRDRQFDSNSVTSDRQITAQFF